VQKVYNRALYLYGAFVHTFFMKKLSLLFLAALALGSCKKNDDNSPAAPSKTDLLTAKKWRVATATVTVAGLPLPGVVQPCSLDDFLKFNVDKTLLHDAGATKCGPTDPQSETGKWDMPSDAKLTITLPASSSLPVDGNLDVKELTATDMHLTSTQTLNSFPTTFDVTLKSF
jgi:hypothetical protein